MDCLTPTFGPNALTFLTFLRCPSSPASFLLLPHPLQTVEVPTSHCCERYMIYDHVCHTQHDGWQGLSFVRSKVLLWSFLLPVSWFVSSRMWKDLFCFFFYFALDPPFSLKLYNLHETTWTHRLRSGLFIANVDASTLPAGRHASLCIVQDFHILLFSCMFVFVYGFV